MRTLKKGRGTFASDKPPVLTLVRRDDGQVRFLVRENLQDVDKDIAEYGDGSVILCTDDYTIYDDIEDKEGVDGHLAVTYSDTYMIGDAHTNTCENRHSFLRQWLAKFKGGLETSPPEIPRLPRSETQLTERLV